MKTLLYFEECESNLSHKLLNRGDIQPIIIRTNKNMRFFSDEYLEATKDALNYVIDYYNDIDDEVDKFRKWLEDNKIIIDYFLNDSEYYLEFSNVFAFILQQFRALPERQCDRLSHRPAEPAGRYRWTPSRHPLPGWRCS